MYGDIPVAKGDDDGSVFAALLKSSRLPSEARPIKWEVLKEVLEKYKVSRVYSVIHRSYSARLAVHTVL